MNMHKIEDFAANRQFSGTVLLSDQQNTNLWSRAYGYSNRSDGIANQMNTRFGIASGCKHGEHS